MNNKNFLLKDSPEGNFVKGEDSNLIGQEVNDMSSKKEVSVSSSSKKLFFILVGILVLLITSTPLIWHFLAKEESEEKIYNEAIEFENMPEIEEEMEEEEAELETVEHDIKNWQLYKNDDFGIEFKYPNDWIPIKIEKQLTQDLFVFDSDNPSIEKIYYYKPDQILALVGLGEEYSYKVGAMEEVDYYHEMRLTYFLQNGTEDIIYNTNSGDCMGGSIGIEDLNFAPCGRYINFFDCCFTSRSPVIFDTAKNRRENMIIGTRYGVYWNDSYEDILWTSDCEKFFIISRLSTDPINNKRDSIWVGEGSFGLYKLYTGMRPIFLVNQIQSSEEKELEIGEMSFITDNRLSFNIRPKRSYDGEGKYDFEPTIMEYEYNVENGEIQKIR